MRYATLMVHLELGGPNAELLQVTAELAERFHAGVIGIAACRPLQMIYSDGYVSGDLYQQDRDDIARELAATEAQFRKAMVQGHVEFIEWRATQTCDDLPGYFSREARAADLVLTAVATGDYFDASRAVDAGELVMQIGRPVLIVPAQATTLSLGHALVAWKDTRETRRAVSDALPMLKLARRVSVVEIVPQADLQSTEGQVQDVAGWLHRHGIEAQGFAQRSTGDDAAALDTIGRDKGADLIVAGAYGHSRLREWVLGGVTRDLLLSANRYALVSH